MPREGGVIVAANHISFFDSVALLQSIPRRAFFIGKAEYMQSWTTRRLFPAMGLIPIEREQARKAMAALEVAADVLAPRRRARASTPRAPDHATACCTGATPASPSWR